MWPLVWACVLQSGLRGAAHGGAEHPSRCHMTMASCDTVLQAQYLDSSPHPHPLAARRMRVEREVTFQPVEGLQPTFICPTNS